MASAFKMRSSPSLPNLLIYALNLLLLLLSSASFAPVFLLRPQPTTFGWALVSVSFTTLLSCFFGFYSQLNHFGFATHVSLAVASMSGQAIATLALFLRHDQSVGLLGSVRAVKEQRVLVVVIQVLLVVLFLVQNLAVASACVVQRWWAREYEAAETEKEAVVRKRRWKTVRVQAEAAEEGVREMDEVIKCKHGQWANNGSQEC